MEEKSPSPQYRAEMSFVDHLEELRWHLVRALVALIICVVIAFAFMKSFFYPVILLGPTKPDFPTYRFLCRLAEKWQVPDLCLSAFDVKLQNITLSGQFMQHIQSSLAVGFVLSFPYIFYEFWKFVKPALQKSEQKTGRFLIVWITLLFSLGVLFSYYVISPYSIHFFANYQLDPNVQNIFTLKNYLSMLSNLVIGSGLIFLIPLIIYFLSKLGIVTPDMLRAFRKQAIVIIFVLSAVITPPDMLSQILVSIPIIILYEISILISKKNIADYNKRNDISPLYQDD